ncbi:DUF1905 domain-containing protein [uncultured Devosia sp.]|uniref:DUF1905 domain-containing protein n=1 Tax=uncultured Devosia sp. TaxID=211434 RepID=UPI0035CC2841
MAEFICDAQVIYWRGPSPYYFAAIPADIGVRIAERSRSVSYGWGVIPVDAEIKDVAFRTSLFSKDGSYLLPLKAKVRSQLGAMDLEILRIAMTLG